jgi:hypothetical protein
LSSNTRSSTGYSTRALASNRFGCQQSCDCRLRRATSSHGGGGCSRSSKSRRCGCRLWHAAF